jgi:3-oxoacyl-[acyl-carrier-protein] synthase II
VTPRQVPCEYTLREIRAPRSFLSIVFGRFRRPLLGRRTGFPLEVGVLTSDRVVVTGMGAVCSLGNSCQEIYGNLVAGKSGVDKISYYDASRYDCRIAAEARGFDPNDFIDRKAAKRMGRYAQIAIAATDQAVAQARLDMTRVEPGRVATVVATAIADWPMVEGEIARIVTDGPGRTNPFTVPRVSTNMASGLVSLHLGATGPGFGVTSACATGSHSLALAWLMLRSGLADVVVAGGTDSSITRCYVEAFTVMGALSTSHNDDPLRASRPFDRNRDGFVLGEGGAVLILETEAHAQARGAPIFAELAGVGMTSDAHHMVAAHPTGAGAAEAIRQALRSGGIRPEEIGYINAHGTSTPLGDPVETRAIKDALGEEVARRTPVSSTKSMMGHCIGGAGALEAMTTVMTLNCGTLPPTINLDEPDEQCDLDYVPNVARCVENLEVAISNSFAFGGQNAVLAFRRWPPA